MDITRAGEARSKHVRDPLDWPFGDRDDSAAWRDKLTTYGDGLQVTQRLISLPYSQRLHAIGIAARHNYNVLNKGV